MSMAEDYDWWDGPEPDEYYQVVCMPIRQTQKALLVEIEDLLHWIPKSIMKYSPGETPKTITEGMRLKVHLPLWYIEQEGINVDDQLES